MPHSETLAETVAGAVRHAIQQGDYLSGERLVELALAHEMNVSQNTVRDALHILEREGWVVKQARRGVYIRTFTPEEVDELYTLWSSLEGLALRWALRIVTGFELAYLRGLVDHTGQHVKTMDWRGALESIFGFHAAVVRLSQKPQTTAMLSRLHNQGRLLENIREMRVPRGLHGWGTQLEAYTHLLDMLDLRDTLAAQQTLQDILMANRDAVQACL